MMEVTLVGVLASIAISAMLMGVGWIISTVTTIKRQTDELHEAHLGPNARDADGAPKWYVRSSLTDAMHELSSTIRLVNRSMQDIHNETKENRRAINVLNESVEALTEKIST